MQTVCMVFTHSFNNKWIPKIYECCGKYWEYSGKQTDPSVSPESSTGIVVTGAWNYDKGTTVAGVPRKGFTETANLETHLQRDEKWVWWNRKEMRF